jgi:hypothetical protein
VHASHNRHSTHVLMNEKEKKDATPTLLSIMTGGCCCMPTLTPAGYGIPPQHPAMAQQNCCCRQPTIKSVPRPVGSNTASDILLPPLMTETVGQDVYLPSTPTA